MNVVVTSENRFERTPDGAVWTRIIFPYSFWRRYLDVFDAVRVVARIHEVANVSADCMRADGSGVSFEAVPYYLGPVQYILRAREVRRVVQGCIRL